MVKVARSLGPRGILACVLTVCVNVACTAPIRGEGSASSRDRTYFVAPGGQDGPGVPGTARSPLKTVGHALERSSGGETIRVTPGVYPPYVDTRERDGTVRVVPTDARRPPLLEYVQHQGGQHVTYDNVRMGALFVGDHPSHKKHVAHHVTVANSEISQLPSGPETCVSIRWAVYAITIRDSFIHDCRNGIHGVRTPSGRARNINILRNRLRDFEVDALQFGHWDDVTIAGNHMSHALDRTRRLHNDMIQFTGSSKDVVVRDNVLHDSAQLLFVQPAFGPIENVKVINNLMFNSRAIAFQGNGVSRLKVVNNTIWRSMSSFGALIRPYKDGSQPSKVVVVNNIFPAFGAPKKALDVYSHNLIEGHRNPRGVGNINGTPGFRNPGQGDFGLRRTSPGAGKAMRRYVPGRDVRGRRRTRDDIGAIDGAETSDIDSKSFRVAGRR